MVKRFTWDENKRKSNIRKHGLDFAHAPHFETETAVTVEDKRGLVDPKFRYPEPRFISIGLLFGQVVLFVYARRQNEIRAISLRPADEEEIQIWLGK
jgi:uncharacterized DUF497 family protein